MTTYIESFLGWLLYNQKKRDSGLITRKLPISQSHPNPTITITSPSCGESGIELDIKYSAKSIGGQDLIPSLSWSIPKDMTTRSEIKEYVLICEDVDVPIPWPIVHGIYYCIPTNITEVKNEDFEIIGDDHLERKLKGGFKYGKNLRSVPYVPPRPIMNHGPHRYFWTILALNEKIDLGKLEKYPKAEEIIKVVEDSIVGWGEWIGTYERKG